MLIEIDFEENRKLTVREEEGKRRRKLTEAEGVINATLKHLPSEK